MNQIIFIRNTYQKYGEIILNRLLNFKKQIKKIENYIFIYMNKYPQKVECNICFWQGSRFRNSIWHKNMDCPKCSTSLRQRLLIAILGNVNNFSFDNIIQNKKILHFGPENALSKIFCLYTQEYFTADLFRNDCDFQIDISDMKEIKDESFDTIILLDVLEHVINLTKAIDEVYRILKKNGSVIITVPQKDHLDVTDEATDGLKQYLRKEKYGHEEHYRIFGEDFPQIMIQHDFETIQIDENNLNDQLIKRHVLFPTVISKHPLATNYRKIFFLKKLK